MIEPLSDQFPTLPGDFAAFNEPWTDAELAALGIRPAHEGGFLFCGVNEQQFAIDGVTHQWPKGSKLGWNLGFSKLGSLSDLDCKGALIEALKEISACCNLDFEYVAPNAANIIVQAVSLDGKQGVLADMQIPMGNVSDKSTRLRGRADASEIWVISETPQPGTIDFYRTMLHEFEHACGLGHGPVDVNDPALIEPRYSPRLRNLQRRDIAELQRRYGKREVAPTPPPTTHVPVPGSKSVHYKGIHEVSQDGKVWRGTVEGDLSRVK